MLHYSLDSRVKLGIRSFVAAIATLFILLGVFWLASTILQAGDRVDPPQMTEEVAVANTLAELRSLEPPVEVKRTIAIHMTQQGWDALNRSHEVGSHQMMPEIHVPSLWVVLFKTADRLERSSFFEPSSYDEVDSSKAALESDDFWFAHEDGTRMGYIVWDIATSQIVEEGQQGQRVPHDLWQAAVEHPGSVQTEH